MCNDSFTPNFTQANHALGHSSSVYLPRLKVSNKLYLGQSRLSLFQSQFTFPDWKLICSRLLQIPGHSWLKLIGSSFPQTNWYYDFKFRIWSSNSISRFLEQSWFVIILQRRYLCYNFMLPVYPLYWGSKVPQDQCLSCPLAHFIQALEQLGQQTCIALSAPTLYCLQFHVIGDFTDGKKFM